MMAEEVGVFSGNDFEYAEIAFKDKVKLGFSIVYAANPIAGKGFFMLRFVVIGPEPYLDMLSFQKFTVRHKRLYKQGGQDVSGRALNRLLIPVFDGSVCPHIARIVGDKLGIWQVLAGWIVEQLEAEGFILSVLDFPAFLASRFPLPEEQVTLSLEFPDLQAGQVDVEN